MLPPRFPRAGGDRMRLALYRARGDRLRLRRIARTADVRHVTLAVPFNA
jgi:hypothetical protein